MRQPEPEKAPNHERWIISYADFTTLLLATFVVMYAVSSINSSKFQEMAEAFSTAFIGRTLTTNDSGTAAAHKGPFNFMPSPVHVPIVTRQQQIKNLPPALHQEEAERAPPSGRPEEVKELPLPAPPPAPPTGAKDPLFAAKPEEVKTPSLIPPYEEVKDPAGAARQQAVPISLPDLRQAIERRVEALDVAYEKLKQALAPLIGKGQVRVSLQSLGVVIDINEVLLFKSGKAELTPQALPLIDQVAGILKELPYQIQVNGFSDTAPIHTAQFDSNWDLSATRAIAVVKRFATVGVDPTLLVGAGFGEFHPVASNATPEGKALNRRVTIVVVSPIGEPNPLRTPMVGTPQARNAKPPAAAPPAPIPTAPAAGRAAPASP